MNETIDEWAECVNCFDEGLHTMEVISSKPLMAVWQCVNCGCENMYPNKGWKC